MFELAVLAKRGIHPRIQCTMQAAGLLLGVRRRSLAEACSIYLGADVPKAHQTSDPVAKGSMRIEIEGDATQLHRCGCGKTVPLQPIRGVATFGLELPGSLHPQAPSQHGV